MENWDEIDKKTRGWLKEAGKNIVHSFTTVLDIQSKSNANDLVTNMDRETEQFFITKIKESFPGHRIMGEEGFGDKLQDTAGVIWLVDPIDGTMNFVHQQRNFMISIGIYENGEGRLGYIYDVVHEELYYAKAGEGAYWNGERLKRLQPVPVSQAVVALNASWLVSNSYMDPSESLIPLVNAVRGTRSYGSAALEFAYVAADRLDAYITMRLSPWDFAAGKIIVEELGGKVTTLDGEPLSILTGSTVIVSKPGLHDEIMENYFHMKKQA